MPLFAVLGGTGGTGSNIIRQLLKEKDAYINVYVRSRAKLEALIPEVRENQKVQIFAGSIDDVNLMASCLRDTTAAFLAVAINSNQPGATVAQDTAHIVVAALINIKLERPNAQIPKLVVLSAGSAHPKIAAEGGFGYNLIHLAVRNTLNDLRQARKFFELHKSWLNVNFVHPAALFEAPAVGYEVTDSDPGTSISYADLASGMIEVATSDHHWRAVCVKTAGGKAPFSASVFPLFFMGILVSLFPLSFTIFQYFSFL